jgi:hypothetical protein
MTVPVTGGSLVFIGNLTCGRLMVWTIFENYPGILRRLSPFWEHKPPPLIRPV